MTITIKHRYTGAALFKCDVPDTVASGLEIRYALEKAIEANAVMGSAELSDANLRYAELSK